MHIAQGVMKALNVNKLTKSGVTFKFWVADWFAQLNNKMGGDLAKIKVVGDYMVSSFFFFLFTLSAILQRFASSFALFFFFTFPFLVLFN